MSALRQIVRGCGALPHVGSHPGTGMLIIFILLGAAAGVRGGWRGALGGAAFMALFMVPMYLYGAYGRANDSDQLAAQGKDTPP
jgi:hypothetical protein